MCHLLSVWCATFCQFGVPPSVSLVCHLLSVWCATFCQFGVPPSVSLVCQLLSVWCATFCQLPSQQKRQQGRVSSFGIGFKAFVGWLVGRLTSQQQASVSQGRICSDNFTCCHTEIEVADPAFYLTQSQYTDTGPTSPSADPITPGAWQGSPWSANF